MTTASDNGTCHSKKLVIIESPCAAGNGFSVNDNMTYLDDVLRDSLARNEAPIASHGLFAFSGVLDDDDTGEREQGIQAGLAWYRAADLIVICQDLGISVGMERGIRLAAVHGVPIEYRNIK